jgi:ABC-type Fe3+-hydroxamate transport system substrate-binding protein
MKQLFALLLLLAYVPIQAQEASPQRIVALSPHTAELVYFAGGENRLIGVSAFSDFPESVKTLPLVGDANGFNRELLLKLKPDLVIAWKQSLDSQDIAWLQKESFQLFLSDPMSLDAIADEIEMLGELLNTQESAQESIDMMEQARLELRATAAARQRTVRVMHQLWNSPLMALTDQSMVSAVLSLCGIETPVHVENRLSATLSKEQMYTAEIDAIIVDDKGQIEPVNPNGVPVVRVDTLKLHRASPRMLESALQLCRKF